MRLRKGANGRRASSPGVGYTGTAGVRSRRAARLAFNLFAAVLAGVAVARPAPAQPRCMQHVTPDFSTRLPYTPQRGGQCEGYYLRRLSTGTALHLVSLTATRRSFEPRHHPSAGLTWHAPPSAAVTVTAASMLPLTRYLMSVDLAPGTRSYTWPLHRITGTPLRGHDLGFLAWATMRVGSRDERVFLPVAIGPPAPGALPARYRMDVMPDGSVTEVHVAVTRFHARDGVEAAVYSRRVQAGPYTARTPFPIDLPDPGPPGLYHVQVSADAEGSRTTTEFWLYHQTP